ncbi:conserved hypothetical protein [Ricinus communis]|uniref:Uncharacterized protein n=1 Tax=Ricinus communis TaxID=3988 RepID=B9SG99_RICCO|nr:conserved hypothetical protein [Ricinus communis]
MAQEAKLEKHNKTLDSSPTAFFSTSENSNTEDHNRKSFNSRYSRGGYSRYSSYPRRGSYQFVEVTFLVEEIILAVTFLVVEAEADFNGIITHLIDHSVSYMEKHVI